MSASGVETSLRLEGPYFTPANPSTYKTVVCLVAGTGLSGAIAIAAAFEADKLGVPHDTKQPLTMTEARTKPQDHVRRWQRCIVVWTVRQGDYTDMPFFDCESSL